MLLYTNKTRFDAIVTLKIESTETPEAAVKVGTEVYFENFGAKSGYLDVKVEGGQELHLSEKTIASLITVRSAP